MLEIKSKTQTKTAKPHKAWLHTKSPGWILSSDIWTSAKTSTAVLHCLARPRRGSREQCLQFHGHSPPLWRRGVWLCTRWWHPPVFHQHQGWRHTAMHFLARTSAKQSMSILQACMPKVLAHRADGSPLPFPIYQPEPQCLVWACQGVSQSLVELQASNSTAEKALLRAATFRSACLQKLGFPFLFLLLPTLLSPSPHPRYLLQDTKLEASAWETWCHSCLWGNGAALGARPVVFGSEDILCFWAPCPQPLMFI